jgi:two-component system cell cycle response regulator CtrA
MRVLIVASTIPAGQRLLFSLGREGFSGEVVALDTDAAAAARQTGPYDAILLESASIGRAVADGVREIARQRLGIPLVVLAAAATPASEAEVLAMGADEVLLAPISVSSLVVRLRALHRRMLGHLSAWITCGNITLDQANGAVTVDGRAVRVTKREFDVLELLLLRRGTLVSKDDFLQRLYGSEDGPDSRTLDVFICKLRRKLAAAGAAEFIRTAWGRGYMAEEPPVAGIDAARSRFASGQVRRPRRLTRPARAWAEAEPAAEVAAAAA